MAQYIPKSAIVAEIERLKSTYSDDENIHHVTRYNLLVDILSFLNTLEVKDVDLEEEVDKWYNNEAPKEFEHILYREIENFAKYFFELGLQAKDE